MRAFHFTIFFFINYTNGWCILDNTLWVLYWNNWFTQLNQCGLHKLYSNNIWSSIVVSNNIPVITYDRNLFLAQYLHRITTSVCLFRKFNCINWNCRSCTGYYSNKKLRRSIFNFPFSLISVSPQNCRKFSKKMLLQIKW